MQQEESLLHGRKMFLIERLFLRKWFFKGEKGVEDREHSMCDNKCLLTLCHDGKKGCYERSCFK